MFKADLSCSGLHYVYGHGSDNSYNVAITSPLGTTGGLGVATPKNAASVQPAALAELQMTGVSALMTYRLELCYGSIHTCVGTGLWADCKNSRRGRDREPMVSLVLSDRGLAPGLCHITLPPQQTTNEG